MAAEFLPREVQKQSPEVHVAGMCVREIREGRNKVLQLLIARRDEWRALYPGLYEGCGGQLAPNETFGDGVTRHFRQEMRIAVRVFLDLHGFYTIDLPDGGVIPGIRFLCEQIDNATPQSTQHTEVRWVSEAEFRDIPAEEFAGDLKREVLELLTRYHRR